MADATNKEIPIGLAFPVVDLDLDAVTIEQLTPTDLSPVDPNSTPSEKTLSSRKSPSSRSAALDNYNELIDEMDSDTFPALTMNSNSSNSDPRSGMVESDAILTRLSDVQSQVDELENVVKELEQQLEQIRSETEVNKEKQELLTALTRAHHCTLAPYMELEFLRSIQQLQTDAATKRDREIESCDDCMLAYIEQPASVRLCKGGYLTTSTATVSSEEDLETVGDFRQ